MILPGLEPFILVLNLKLKSSKSVTAFALVPEKGRRKRISNVGGITSGIWVCEERLKTLLAIQGNCDRYLQQAQVKKAIKNRLFC